MQRKENFLSFFIVFFSLSLALILLGNSGVIISLSSFVNKSVEPARSASIDLFSLRTFQNKQIKSLIEENTRLKKQVSDYKNLTLENKALKNQFVLSNPSAQTLLSAKVIGAPGFVPGVSLPEFLIINIGSTQGLQEGDAVILGNNLIGKIGVVNSTSSKVELVTSSNSSFTAKVEGEREISGIIKGKGIEEMVLENVLLSENLKEDMLILTKGDKDLPARFDGASARRAGKAGEDGMGYPPDLVVGKIITIEKKESELFQKALVLSQIDFKNLEYVFVIMR